MTLRRGPHPLSRRMLTPSEAAAWARALPRRSALPTFLLIGTPQAASTWLHSNLGRHPDIDLPWKEMRVWSRWPRIPMWLYATAFRADRPVRGDMSPHYGVLREPVIAKIHRAMPALRLVLIARDPIERAWSAVRRRSAARDRADLAAVQEILDDVTDGYRGLRRDADYGAYSAILATWEAYFGRDALHVARFRDVQERPRVVVEGVLRHVGADPARYPWSELDASPVNPNPVAPMPAAVRTYLAERYSGEPARLARYVSADEPW